MEDVLQQEMGEERGPNFIGSKKCPKSLKKQPIRTWSKKRGKEGGSKTHERNDWVKGGGGWCPRGAGGKKGETVRQKAHLQHQKMGEPYHKKRLKKRGHRTGANQRSDLGAHCLST